MPQNYRFSALRLAAYLAIIPSITSDFISEKCNYSVVFTSRHLTIGKGKGDGPNTKVAYTRNNNLGLVLRISNSENALLTGACEYNQLPNTLLNQINNYEYLVVSHHGANIKQHPWQNYLKTSVTRRREAFVCVGKNRAYPKTAHLQLLNQNGYSVTETRNSKYPYPITFSI
ncbi:hypothetical protein [Macrococcoides caseolyticum]|uniref:hypothetical protein n=1 Tax=Macrococcoides caseolyticum TaxID=69966 RepID=UPI003F5EB449